MCHFGIHFEVVEVDGGEEEVDLLDEFCFGRHDYNSW
jgi:hypothetical protein